MTGETKNVAGCTRKDSRKRKIENTDIDRVLDRRGVKDVSDGIDKQLAELLFKGRLETQRQKTFQGKVISWNIKSTTKREKCWTLQR